MSNTTDSNTVTNTAPESNDPNIVQNTNTNTGQTTDNEEKEYVMSKEEWDKLKLEQTMYSVPKAEPTKEEIEEVNRAVPTDAEITTETFVSPLHEKSNEHLQINDTILDVLPVDISSFSDNAVYEESYMRSKAVFAFRSKYSSNKIIITLPVNIDPFVTESEAFSTQYKGIRVLTQLSSYPFCFIRSARVRSYLSSRASTSTSGFMMFGVDEINYVIDMNLPDVLFAEIHLKYYDHTSQIADFMFRNDDGSETDDPFYSDLFRQAFNFEHKQNIEKAYEYLSDIKNLDLHTPRQGAYSTPSELSTPILGMVGMLAPIVTSPSQIEAGPNREYYETLRKLGLSKKVVITSPTGEDSLTADAVKQANNGADNQPLNKDGSVNTNYKHAELKLEHEIFWANFHDFSFGGVNSIQSIKVSLKNKLVAHHIGAHKYPILQYMGRYPARVQMVMTMVNYDLYSDENYQGVVSAVHQLSNVLDYNNEFYPEVSAYNTLKIQSIPTHLAGITNVVPHQTFISAEADSQDTEKITVTFVEADVEEFMKIGTMFPGRASYLGANSDHALEILVNYFIKVTTDESFRSQIAASPNKSLYANVHREMISVAQHVRKEIMGVDEKTSKKLGGAVTGGFKTPYPNTKPSHTGSMWKDFMNDMSSGNHKSDPEQAQWARVLDDVNARVKTESEKGEVAIDRRTLRSDHALLHQTNATYFIHNSETGSIKEIKRDEYLKHKEQEKVKSKELYDKYVAEAIQLRNESAKRYQDMENSKEGFFDVGKINSFPDDPYNAVQFNAIKDILVERRTIARSKKERMKLLSEGRFEEAKDTSSGIKEIVRKTNTQGVKETTSYDPNVVFTASGQVEAGIAKAHTMLLSAKDDFMKPLLETVSEDGDKFATSLLNMQKEFLMNYEGINLKDIDMYRLDEKDTDPFFYLSTYPYFKEEDFHKAYEMLNAELESNLQPAITRPLKNPNEFGITDSSGYWSMYNENMVLMEYDIQDESDDTRGYDIMGNPVEVADLQYGLDTSNAAQQFTSEYTGEFPPHIKNKLGSLQASTRTSIGVGQPPGVRALLDLISRLEGTHEAKGRLGYGEYYTYSSKARGMMAKSVAGAPHPKKYFDGPSGKSSAAGRYQYVFKTWSALMGANTHMTPQNQDAAVVKYLKNNKFYDHIVQGDIEAVYRQFDTRRIKIKDTYQMVRGSIISFEWASIPKNYSSAKAIHGNTLTGNDFITAYKNLYSFYSGVKVAPRQNIQSATDKALAANGEAPAAQPTSNVQKGGNQNKKNSKTVSNINPVDYANKESKMLDKTVRLQGHKTTVIPENRQQGYTPGKVTGIIDGDTIEIDGRTRVRLAYIDTKESSKTITMDQKDSSGKSTGTVFTFTIKGEAGSDKQVNRLKAELPVGTEVAIPTTAFEKNKDQNGRVVAEVFNRSTGRSVNLDLIASGSVGVSEDLLSTNSNLFNGQANKAQEKRIKDEVKKSKEFRKRVTEFQDKLSKVKTQADANKLAMQYKDVINVPSSGNAILINDKNSKTVKEIGKNEKAKYATPPPKNAGVQGKPGNRLLGYVGNTGASRGAHIHLAYPMEFAARRSGYLVVPPGLKVKKTAKPKEEHYSRIKVNGKSLKDARVSSNYGWRSAGFHAGIDFPFPDGTPIYTDYAVTKLSYGWTKANGNFVDVHFDDGVILRMIHLNDKTRSLTKSNTGSSSGLSSVTGKLYTNYDDTTESYLEVGQDTTVEPVDASKQVQYKKRASIPIPAEIPKMASVFYEPGAYQIQARNMAYIQQYGLGIGLPCIKVYVVVGNEVEDPHFHGALMLNHYFEIDGIKNFLLVCNNDDNPVDLLSFEIANASFIKTDNYAVNGQFLSRNFDKIGTTAEYSFVSDRVKLKPGTRLHIRMGYGNDPNKLHTVFNGVLTNMVNSNNGGISLKCEAEGYGRELLLDSISPVKATQPGNVFTTDSTPLIISTALGNREGIASFGNKVGFWDTVGALVTSVLPITVKAHDYSDPENKRLTTKYLDVSFRPGNYRQRIFTNIYAAEVEALHSEFNATWWNRLSNLFSPIKASGYIYILHGQTPWAVLKEMEYRHPGTFAKPLFYGDRMTMFYGLPHQMYIARDLNPGFMQAVGENGKEKGRLNNEYLKARPLRFDTVCNFHILSSEINIIQNNISINANYKTQFNVVYFEDKEDIVEAHEGDDLKEFKMKIDDNLAAFEHRTATLQMLGIHSKYSSYMYGTTALRREAEKMYGGNILLIGNPKIKAGDFAYISDNLKRFNGMIKIRECRHYMTEQHGFVTEITPGLYVEASAFVYSSFFHKLAYISRVVMATSSMLNQVASNSDSSFTGYVEFLNQRAQYFNYRGLFDYAAQSFRNWRDPERTARNEINNPITGEDPNGGLMHKSIQAVSKGLHKTGEAVGYAAGGLLGTYTAWTGTASLVTALSDGRRGLIARAAVAYPTAALKGVWRGVSLLARPALGLGVILAKAAMAASSALAMGIKLIASAVMAHPLVAGLVAVGAIVFAYVHAKVQEIALTRQPIMVHPLMHNGRPYSAGMTGYNYNTYFEALAENVQANFASVSKAAHLVEVTNRNTIVSYLASTLSDHSKSKQDKQNLKLIEEN